MIVTTYKNKGSVIAIKAKQKKELKLLLLAGRNHHSRSDLKSLIQFLESEECGFRVNLQIKDPSENPEILELHKIIAIPALIKLSPFPKQILVVAQYSSN